MATEADAARDRVLAARAALGEDLVRLEASGREAVDIPAKIKRSPAKAAAVVGGLGFLVLKGPQRVAGLGKRAIRGGSAPLPTSMLPEEIEKTLRSMGGDGDKVRGTLERDFAAYAKKASKQRREVMTLLALSVARPLLTRGAKAAGEFLFSTEDGGLNARMERIRRRAEQGIETAREAAVSSPGPTTDSSDPIDAAMDAAEDAVGRPDARRQP